MGAPRNSQLTLGRLPGLGLASRAAAAHAMRHKHAVNPAREFHKSAAMGRCVYTNCLNRRSLLYMDEVIVSCSESSPGERGRKTPQFLRP